MSDAPLQYAIDRFTVFHQVLRICGWVHTPEGRVRSLELRVPGKSAYLLGSFGQASPDLLPHFGEAAGNCRFDEMIRFSEPNAAIVDASLRILMEDGRERIVGALGAPAGDPAHALFGRFFSSLNGAPPCRLLEIGSRARSGVVRRDLVPATWEYSGFDVLAGPNVDVVGDAHQLSAFYPRCYFDAVMGFSVVEHLLMPWKVIIELNRVMKLGASGFFTTHQCWPLHDEPWDFWRLSDQAWKGLLNPATGFEIIEARMGEPAFIVAARCHAVTSFAEVPAGALASSVLFRKTAETRLDWPVSVAEITDTHYPTTTTTLR